MGYLPPTDKINGVKPYIMSQKGRILGDKYFPRRHDTLRISERYTLLHGSLGRALFDFDKDNPFSPPGHQVNFAGLAFELPGQDGMARQP